MNKISDFWNQQVKLINKKLTKFFRQYSILSAGCKKSFYFYLTHAASYLNPLSFSTVEPISRRIFFSPLEIKQNNNSKQTNKQKTHSLALIKTQ